MTREDAAEIILSGKAFELCGYCMGEAKVSNPSKPIYGKRHLGSAPTIRSAFRSYESKNCMTCSGSGVVYREVYLEACKQFDKTPNMTAPFRPHVSEGETLLGFDEDAQVWVVVSDN